MTLALGILVMILGTYSNLEAASGRNIVVPAEGPIIQIPGPDPASQRDIALGEVKKDPALLNNQRLQLPPAPPSLQLSEQRKEPPVPVEPVNRKEEEKPVSKPPQPAEKIPTEKPVSSAPVLDINFAKLADDKKVSPSPMVQEKVVENKVQGYVIHQDAIAKEDLELKEQSKEDQKQKELLDKLQQHQEEQKKLLQEQQNILDEIKSRDPQSVEPQKIEVNEKLVEPINPEKFSDNIDKIQDVIDDLKERKQVMDKNKGEKIAEEKKRFAEKKIVEKSEVVAKKLVNLQNLSLDDVKKVDKPTVGLDLKPVDSVLPGRDILEEKAQVSLEREKRDAEEAKNEEGSCKKPASGVEGIEKEKYIDKVKPLEGMDSSDGMGSIQQLERLSPPADVKVSSARNENKDGVSLVDVVQGKQNVRRRK